MNEPQLILDLGIDELRAALTTLGQPAYRVQQIWQALYQKLIDDPQQITNLPADLRQQLAERFRFSSQQVKAVQRSTDGSTEKLLLALPDGPAIEAVLMRYHQRNTACISSQAGCALGCTFCATGQMGFKRNLSAGEILEQVLLISRRLEAQGQRLTNIVLMGMGEPFHNYDAVLKAVDRLSDPQGMRFGARRITISTVGLVPGIERFTAEKRQTNLAISLHAANNELREQLLPINQKYPLEQLIPACRSYVEETGRRITFEWALIEGVNDRVQDAAEFSRLVSGLNCHVNMIPLNPTAGYSGEGSSRQRADAFAAVLDENGIANSMRLRRGIAINAGCGQLAALEEPGVA